MKYQLDYIQGIGTLVHAELMKKHPTVFINKIGQKNIFFTAKEPMQAFKDLHTALKISDEESGEAIALAKPEWRKETVPAGINPALAYCLCEISDIWSEAIVYDPFCGAGTIPIMAALYCTKQQVIASDISGKAIDKTVMNAKAANVRERMRIFQSDIGKVKLQHETIDRIITNLPFGIRVGTHEKNVHVYMTFAKKAARLLKKQGKLVFLTQEKRLIGETFTKFDQLQKIDEIAIKQGGLEPHIFVYKKV